jgi:DNA-binding response OmpR family regulator
MLDLKMPNLDGFGYCELVRKDHTLSRMPIIVQTSADDRETKIRALSCGVDDFLNKPFDPVELGLRARIHLSRYFMLQDANEMCIYLKWELEEAKSVMQRVQESNLSNVTQYRLHRHYEALEAMSLISIVAT